LNNNNSKTVPGDLQRGSEIDLSEPRFLVIGRILKPHGVRGEMRVEILTDLPERFTWLDEVYIGKREPIPRKIDSIRFHKSWVLLRLVDCDDRESAHLLRGQLVQIPESEGIPLEEGEYYLYQLVGLKVVTEDGEYLGKISEIIETKANNVFVVKTAKSELLLPDIEDVIRDIDFESSTVTVRLMPGLVP
jgi:16S rRNA processing protein RimM